MYIPRQKWTMNETLILSKYNIFSKSNKTEAVFTKTEMSNEEKVNFLQNNPLGVHDNNGS